MCVTTAKVDTERAVFGGVGVCGVGWGWGCCRVQWAGSLLSFSWLLFALFQRKRTT